MIKQVTLTIIALLVSIASFAIPAISGPSALCAGMTLTMTDSMAGGTWSSSNTSVATVGSLTGTVTAVSPGTSNIIYYVPAVGYSILYLTVNPNPAPISGPSTVTVGSYITLTDASPGGIWSASCSILTIGSTTGIVTGTAPGICNLIKYTFPGTGCLVYYTDTITAASVAPITGTTNVCAGSTVTLSDATTGGTWTSSNTAIATINATSGVVTGVSAGTCTITFTHSGSYVTTSFTVNPLPAPITGPGTVAVGGTITLTDATTGGTWSSACSIVTTGTSIGYVTGISPGICYYIKYTLPTGCYVYYTDTVTSGGSVAPITGTTHVCVGSTITLSDATTVGTWTSSNTAIATINATSGVVTGVSAGTCTITYTHSGSYVTASFIVYAPPTAITGSSSVCVGSTTTEADATPGGAWASGNTSVATVTSTGVVTGVSAGTVGIYYLMTTGCATYKVVTVNAIPTVTGSSTVCIGSTTTLTGTPTGGTWTTSNSAVAAVGSTGIVTGVAGGVANIYYNAGGCYAYHYVTVNAAPSISGSSTLCAGTTTTLTGTPAGGTWTTSNSAVATVGSTGIVTGVAGGVANIYYNAGGCYAYHYVTVNATATISGSSTLCAGSTITLTSSLTGGTWSTSNSAVATVGSTGIVSGVAGGIANIYYYAGGCYASHYVTVNAASTISGGSTVCAGSSITLTGTPAGGTWTTSGTTIATVGSTGIVTGVATGVVNVYYNAGGCYSYHFVTVNAAASVSGSSSVCAGSTISLTASPSGGTWISSNTATATVGSTGIVTGVAAGTVNIYYSNGGCNAYHTVTVNAASSISGSSSVCVGSTTTLTGTPSGGNWFSSGTSIATIGSSTGLVTGLTTGTVNIYYNGGGCYSYQTLTVNATASVSGSSTVCAGSTITLTGTPSGGTWTTSGTSIATVSTSGVVTGVTGGVVNVYYNAGGCYAYHMVTVNAAPAISGSSSVCAGPTITLTGTPSGGTWSTSNSAIATVGSTGIVTGVAGGVANIYYYAGGCYAGHYVTVNAAPVITGGSTVCAGSTLILAGTPSGGTWSTSNSAVATVGSTGIVTGVAGGVANIYYYAGGCYTGHYVTVNPTPAAITATYTVGVGGTVTITDATTGGTWSSGNTAIATINATTGLATGISAGTVGIYYILPSGCGTGTTLTVTGTSIAPITGTTHVCAGSTVALYDATTGAATWSSSNTAIATVNATSGIVTGVSAGTCTITFTYGGSYVTTSFTVNPLPAAITGSSSLCAGTVTTLTDATTGGTWSSSNTAVATEGTSIGITTGIAPGSVNIYYTLTTGCSVYKTITVTAAPSAISGSSSVCIGSSATLTDATTGGTWMSVYSTYATVGSASGIVTGVTAGTTSIVYTVGGCSVSMTVSVNAAPDTILGAGSVCVGSTILLSEATTGGAWYSGITGIATVSSTGNVTGVSAGVLNIYYSIGGCYRYHTVTVNPVPAAISGSSTVSISGGPIILTDATSGGTWFSGIPSLATIGATTGVVTGVSAGTLNIYYSIGGCAVYKTITVTSPAPPGYESSTTGNQLLNGLADVTIYPNPTSGVVNLQLYNQAEGRASVTITDITGREVFKTDINIQSASEHSQIDLSNLKAGVYIIGIQSGELTHTNRLVIER